MAAQLRSRGPAVIAPRSGMRLSFFLVGVIWATRAFASPEAEITAMLLAQSQAWNRGDIEEFMASYAQTEDLRFASKGTVTRGWKATLEQYKARYPDKAAMGTLAFSTLEITLLAPDAAIVFGHWELAREKDKPGGLFTLTIKKVGNDWRIFQDHTSSATP